MGAGLGFKLSTVHMNLELRHFSNVCSSATYKRLGTNIYVYGISTNQLIYEPLRYKDLCRPHDKPKRVTR